VDNVPLSIGRALRERRKKLGLTQLDAAELADVSVRFVHDCEAGKPTVQLDRVHALANALGFTLTLSLREPGQLENQESTR
jgi:HTH-type transcriptional regulator/antitoxin HipB